MSKSVMGMFQYAEDSLEAAKKLRSAGFDGLHVMSPIPMHDAYEALEFGVSNVRRYSLAGAIIGAISGFALATACALVFILPTGGRAIIAFPPFLVITYELTILIGVIATLIGFHIVSGLPAWKDAPYQPEIIVDRFSVAVDYEEETEMEEATRMLHEAGAEEVRSVVVEEPYSEVVER
jgi:hypothetical protein